MIYYASWTRTIKTDWLKHKTRNQHAIDALNDWRILCNQITKQFKTIKTRINIEDIR